MEVIELILDEDNLKQGVYAVSVVEHPAIEEDWVALNKHYVELKEVDEEKRLLMGAALIPDKKILRIDEKTKQEYYIFFTKETIRKASELFLKRNKQSNATYEHMKEVNGMTVVESWIVEDEKQDKSAFYGFSLPVGTWVISMKVDNNDVWQKVKAGEVKGFSIEGYFESKEELSKHESIVEQIKNILNAADK
jgi:hypothetical protein